MSPKASLRPFLTLAGVLATLAPMAVRAQDYFREYGTSRSSGGIGPVWPSEYTYNDISPSGLAPLDETAVSTREENEHNMRLGPVNLAIAAFIGAEFNDNIALSDDHRQSDIIIRPGLNIDADLPLSDLNHLRFSVGLSYAKYLDHSRYDTDGVLVSPTSDLEFNFVLGQVKFTMRDRFSYQEDPFDIQQLSNVAKYDRYENQAGIKATYNPNSSIEIVAGFDHYNLWTKQDVFSDQDRAIETVFVKPSFDITPAVKVGVNATYSYISFDSGDRSSGNNFMVGPFLEWQLSDATNLYLEGGYQSLTYDGGYTPTRLLESADLGITADQRRAIENEASDNSDSNSWYVRFELANKPSESFQHRISFSRTTEIGFFTNSFDLYHVEYSAEYKPNEKISIGPSAFYEYYESSGDNSENAHRIGATLGLRYYLTNSLTIGLDYRYLWKDSNFEGSDYYQNLVFLSAYYKF